MNISIRLLIALLFLPFFVNGQSDPVTVWDIQLVSTASPRPADYKKLEPYGYVYEVRQSSGLSRIMLGTYPSESVAKTKLTSVKKNGFKNAIMVKTQYDANDILWLVQLAAFDKKEEIIWGDWKRLYPDLALQISNNKIKLFAGPFNTKAEAEEIRVDLLMKGAPSDIMIKSKGRKLIHVVTDLETGALISTSAVESIDKPTVTMLQQLLATEGYYKGKPDGSMNEATQNALASFKENNRRYRSANALALNRVEKPTEKPAEAGTLQYFIDIIDSDPATAEANLRDIHTPISDVWLAYIYMTDLVEVADKTNTVNTLMNEATKEIFSSYKGATRYSYKQPYTYTDVQMFLNHLCDIQMASEVEIALPCWMLAKYPEEVQQAFAPYWGSSKDDYKVAPGCAGVGKYREIEVVRILAEALDPEEDAQKSNVLLLNYRANEKLALTALAKPEPLLSGYGNELKTWDAAFTKSMIENSNTNPLYKRMINVMLIAYLEAKLMLQYSFIQKNISPEQSLPLAIQILRGPVDFRLYTYMVIKEK